MARDCLLITLLRSPASVSHVMPLEWDLVMRQARRAGLLAQLYLTLESANQLAKVPERVLRHMRSDWQAVQAQNRAVAWEAYCLQRTLAPLGVPLVLLKGAAYVVAGDAMAPARMFNDVDILVPKERLAEVEQVLTQDGWEQLDKSTYDQRYYRDWMHELPPMRHAHRGTALDVHHNLIPPTSRYRLDANLLWQRAIELEGYAGVKVLAPEDRVLHSAAHLLLEGEFERGLRDLLDVACLIEQFSQADPAFWQALLQRAERLGLKGPLYFALQAAQRLLRVEVPVNCVSACVNNAGAAPWRWLLLRLYLLALRPAHRSCDLALSGLARWLLYVRSHAIKMPVRLLLPHLLRKAWQRRVGDESEKA